MYYEINVSFEKAHLFATHKRSLLSHSSMEYLLKLFRHKFPQSEGFDIITSYYAENGEVIDTSYIK